ncbi:MAG: hypothetical protein IPJ81_00690 [Chitinophagaceae bacterium]|nr:hypothetical protein [Chitinophagaceae bacterium]
MSYSIYNPCDEEVIDPVCDPCLNDMEHGRVRSGAYIHKGYLPTLMEDPEDAQKWLDGIADKSIYIIPETLGSFDGGQPVEATGYGDVQSKIVGFNFSLPYKDPNFKGNCDFYNSIMGSSNWHFAFRTETQTRISGKPVTIIPKSPVTEELNSEVVWDVEIKWSEAKQPCPFNTPEGVFVCSNF